MQQRHRSLAVAGSTAGALAFAAVVGAQARSTTWVTHPVIFASTGDGGLLQQFEAKTGIKVEVVTFPNEVLPQRIQSEFVASCRPRCLAQRRCRVRRSCHDLTAAMGGTAKAANALQRAETEVNALFT